VELTAPTVDPLRLYGGTDQHLDGIGAIDGMQQQLISS
jgi:hypothetical protein